MPIPALTSQQRAPRRGRYLIPIGTPRRGELVAALATAAVLAHLVFAQVTLLLLIAFSATGRLARWRPQWLMIPAAAGVVWALAIGPATAAARFAAGPRQVLGYLAGAGGHPGRILHPAGAFAGLTHWLPGQVPLALVLAAAEASGLCWLDRLHAAELKMTTSNANPTRSFRIGRPLPYRPIPRPRTIQYDASDSRSDGCSTPESLALDRDSLLAGRKDGAQFGVGLHVVQI